MELIIKNRDRLGADLVAQIYRIFKALIDSSSP
jgi:hypothetical protein